MLLKKKLLKNSNVYVILDAQVNEYAKLIEITKQAMSAGVNLFQLRDKVGTAKRMIDFSEKFVRVTRNKAILIINDRVDLAKIACFDGVHLGQDDVPLEAARRILGSEPIVGVSCQTLAHCRKAMKEGADYIGFGSVFKTLTKPDRDSMDQNLLMRVNEAIDLPVFAIGGIRSENISSLRGKGVQRFAVCRDICLHEDVKQQASLFKEACS